MVFCYCQAEAITCSGSFVYPRGTEWSNYLPLQSHVISFLSCLSPLFSHMATVQSPLPRHTPSTTELLYLLLLPPGFLSLSPPYLWISSDCQPGAYVLRKRPPMCPSAGWSHSAKNLSLSPSPELWLHIYLCDYFINVYLSPGFLRSDYDWCLFNLVFHPHCPTFCACHRKIAQQIFVDLSPKIISKHLAQNWVKTKI